MKKDALLKRRIGILFLVLFFVSGCGYTTRSQLSSDLRSIYVENFTNKISVTEEQGDARMYRGYRPGMEVDITKAVIDRFIFDGNLKVVNIVEDSDIILKGELIDFKKEALRYDRNNNVEEYRVRAVVNIELKSARTDKTVWKEKEFAGEATYRTGGSLAATESASIKEATSDLARRVVERTIEGW